MTKSIVEKLNLHKFERAAILDEPEGANYFAGLSGGRVTFTARSRRKREPSAAKMILQAGYKSRELYRKDHP